MNNEQEKIYPSLSEEDFTPYSEFKEEDFTSYSELKKKDFTSYSEFKEEDFTSYSEFKKEDFTPYSELKEEGFIPCLTCAKPCKSVTALKQHQEDSYHYKGPAPKEKWTKPKMLYAYLNAYYETKALVSREDQKKCRKIVQHEIKEIREVLKKDDGSTDFHNSTIEPAGSTATQTKVSKADEFDFNVVINDYDIEVVDETDHHLSVKSGNKLHDKHLSEHWKVEEASTPNIIPKGFTTIRYNGSETLQWVDYNTRYIIPRWVQEDLYIKMKEILQIKDNVKVSCNPHGPAITVFISKPTQLSENHKCEDQVSHDISVDFAVAIKVDKQQIPVDGYGWPRKKTKKCLPQQTIDRILNAGVYLVPKDDLFWYISFSNASKVLMRSIDTAETCRRTCHKILKRDFLKWKGEEHYKGISTFIFKNHLFWHNERLDVKNREKYWTISNIGKCYVELLKDLKERLVLKELPNYFNAEDNLFKSKDTDVLNRLANRIAKRIKELNNIILKYD